MGGFGQLFSVFGRINLGNVLGYVIIAIGVIVFLTLIIFKIREINSYKFKVRVLRTRESGKIKENNYVGGFISRKGTGSYFRVKTGRLPWQFIDFTTTPDTRYIDEDDRVYYKQIDVDSFVQMRREIDKKALNLIPVESDVKYGAILAIHRTREILEQKSWMEKYGTHLTIGFMVVAFIIAYGFLTNAKCPG